MKAIIVKIQDSKVYAKSVNPLGEKPYNWAGSQAPIAYWDDLAKWQQAESDRCELPIEHICVQTGTICGFPCYGGCTIYKELRVNDSIQVTREGNFLR